MCVMGVSPNFNTIRLMNEKYIFLSLFANKFSIEFLICEPT